MACNYCANHHFSISKATISPCLLHYLRYHNYAHPQKEEMAVAHHMLWCDECSEMYFGGFCDNCSYGAKFL